MTDFYKKLYGYEDDIQLKDDDIRLLEAGMTLRKMKTLKEEFNDRFYRLDLNSNCIVASTKEFRKKEKTYALSCINEVNSGCSSDSLKAYKLRKSMSASGGSGGASGSVGGGGGGSSSSFDKKKKKNDTESMDDTAFVVVYDNYNKYLNLLAPNANDRDRWVRVLAYFILLAKKRKGVLPETDKIMRNYFKLADKSNDERLDKNEISTFLDSINIRLKKNKLTDLVDRFDEDRDGHLDQQEFDNLIQELYQRHELISLFQLIDRIEMADDAPFDNHVPEHVSVDKFRRFLHLYQNEIKSEEECKQLVRQYEDDKDGHGERLTLVGFVNYITAPEQHLADPTHTERVYQNMDHPFAHYFINSSHNTYLVADQIGLSSSSSSKPEGYIAAIMKGARLVEADVYDGSDGTPKIYHHNTLTSKIAFEDALVAIREYAFKLTDYPLIITIELHCSSEQQQVMASLIHKHLGEFLFDSNSLRDPHFIEPYHYPTLNQLKRKIIFRCRRPAKPAVVAEDGENMRGILREARQESFESETSVTDDDSTAPTKAMPHLDEFINLLQNASFKGVDYAFENYHLAQTSSLSESKAKRVLEEEDARRLITYTTKYVTKVYPAFYRQDSSNLRPLDYWVRGVQIAALNFQNMDLNMQLNAALFADNGACGFVLKPDILLRPELGFDPTSAAKMARTTMRKRVDLKIISAHQLPKSSLASRDITDPYVRVRVFGVACDQVDVHTKAIHDNGLKPIWNEDFSFTLSCPPLAIVHLAVVDDNLGKDATIGHFACRFVNMRHGYRHVRLVNKLCKGTLFLAIKVKSLPPTTE